MFSSLPNRQKRKPRKVPAKRQGRRVCRVNVTPPETYETLASASSYTGVSVTSIRRVLDTGVFCGGIWESVDPPKTSIQIEVDGVTYPSASQAAIAIKVSRSAFSRQIGQGLKEFTVRGHLVKVVEVHEN